MGNKGKIVEEAVRLFTEQGYEGTPTFQNLSNSDVTEPAIYHHFKGKDDIFAKLDKLLENHLIPFEKVSVHFEIEK